MYPSTIYSQINPTENTFIDDTGFFLDVIIGYLNDNVTAIETKLGVDGSAVVTTIDYLLKNSASINPGHKHTTTSINFTADQNFVSASQLTIIGNTSGINTGDETLTTIKTKLGITTLSGSNTGDQDLSGYATISDLSNKADKTNVLELNNTTAFTPINNYEPATKKYVDDNVNVGSLDGWTPDTDTWVRVSVSSFKITGKDVTAKFPIGTRLKFTQTTDKFAVVVARSFSTDTTVTIAINTDYTIANATITSPYYSYQDCPQGYPGWFNFTPTYTNLTVGNATNTGYFRINGKKVDIRVRLLFGSTTSVTGAPIICSNLGIGTLMPDYDGLSPIGIASFTDVSAGTIFGAILAAAGYLFTVLTGQQYANTSSTAPINGITNGDVINFNGWYLLQ